MKMPLHLDSRLRHRWLSLCLSGSVGLWCAGTLPAQDSEPADEPAAEEAEEEKEELTEWVGGNTEFLGWANFTVGEAFLELNKPEFRRRYGANAGGFGGLSEFAYENFVGDNGYLKLGGYGLAGRDTYGFNVAYTDDMIGYLRFGIDKKRYWSTGNGGFFPPLSTWQPLDADMLHLDREKIWVEAGLTLEDKPVYRVGYSHSTREGAIDSTVWGAPTAFGTRGVTASFRGIDETRDVVTLDVEHTVGETEAGIGFRFDTTRVKNSLNVRWDADLPAETRTTQNEVVQTDLFGAHAHTVTPLSTNLAFTTGYSFTRLDTDLSGSRIEGTTFDAVFDPAVQRFPAFLDLAGGTVLNQHVLSLNLLSTPSKDWAIIPAIRAESSSLDGTSFFTATPGAGLLRQVQSEQDFLDFSERLEVRFTGVTNWVFRMIGEWDQKDGDLNERQRALNTGVLQMARDTDFTRFGQKYTLGANWYPRARLNVAAQYYYKRRDNRYNHGLDTTLNAGGDRYPAYLRRQNFATHDINFRITARPCEGVVSVTRYDHQLSDVETGGNSAPIDNADIQTHIISQSVTWSPLSRLYLQGTASYVKDSTDTPATTSGATAIVTESQNDYWTAGGTIAYALSLKTDLNLDYVYSRADNYFDNSAGSQPYDAGFEEHRAMASITQRLSENLRLLWRYGWFRNRDETYGGNLNYTAHLVSTTLQYRF